MTEHDAATEGAGVVYPIIDHDVCTHCGYVQYLDPPPSYIKPEQQGRHSTTCMGALVGSLQARLAAAERLVAAARSLKTVSDALAATAVHPAFRHTEACLFRALADYDELEATNA